MVEEYKIKAADLVEIADVIREKGNTTEELVWPEGWKDAIRDLSSLNFEVVGGTIQPENPKENTIWVNTDQEITRWAFSIDEPTELTDGVVWIKTQDTASVSLNGLTEGTLMIYPVESKQYKDGSWTNKDSFIYQSDAWIIIDQGYLFKNGNECEAQTGGWTINGFTFQNYNLQAGYVSEDRGMILLPTVDSSTITALCTTNKIDLNGVDIIEIDALTDGNQHTVACLSANTEIAGSRVNYVVLNNGVTHLPVTSFNESYYVVLYLDGGSSTSGNVSGIRSVKLI